MYVAVADPLISQAYSAYLTYHDDPSRAHYTAFHDAAVAATAASSAFSTLITGLGQVVNTDAAQLANAGTLATNVVDNRGTLTDFDPSVSSAHALLKPSEHQCITFFSCFVSNLHVHAPTSCISSGLLLLWDIQG